MKVVAIGGSPRLDGNTNFLIDQVLNELASRGVETEKIVLSQYKISPCQAHDNYASFSECKQQDDAPWILEKFTEADGIIMASPVYFTSISAQIKTFIDRNFFLFTHERPLKAKCAGLIVSGGRGVEDTLEALNVLVRFSNIKVFTLGYSERSPAKDNAEFIKKAKDMGRQMTEVLLQA